MKFNDMQYRRPEPEKLRDEYKRLAESAANASALAELEVLVARHEKLMCELDTMASLAYVRHTINTEDEFYTAENDFCDESFPVIQEGIQEFMLALCASPLRAQLDERYGELLFRNLELDLKCFSSEIIPELQEENRLANEYQRLIASAQIPFDGKTLNISQLGAYKTDADREVRKNACFADGAFYASHAEELDDIFAGLVKIRTEIAHKLGFDSFVELAYLRRCRNCYDPAMVKNFREQVKRELVPVVCKLKEKQAERIGITDMKFWDDGFGYKEGNPRPHGTPDDILAAGGRMYREMSPETHEFIDFMYENGLLDVTAKKGKAVGGYCTGFPLYKAPFIFSNFNGTSGDVDVLTHEAGHAYAAYRSRDFELLENMNPTMESCEVHSMSMEFLAWPWLPLFYGDEVERARFMHLESALVFIPYGCMVDEFQHIVYADPDMTPAQRHEAWKALEREYRPYLDFADTPFYSEGRGWQRQLHIFQYPFYYIDYCLAQTAALEFWALSQSGWRDAWERYNRFVAQGGNLTFTGLCEIAAIKNPFEDGCLSGICETARTWLDKNGN